VSSTGDSWSDALIGKVLQETYRIERSIGSGGMGSVYEASHLRLPKRFAVKMLSHDVVNIPEALARFRQEALVTSALGNPNIVEVFDFNHMEDGTPYIIMELLRGEDLAARLERQGRLPLASMVNIFQQAASALHAAHQKGIIHRDLKPQNVFLCQREEREDYVKIVDFGISKVLGSRHAMTGTHELLGSPSYMSPEQALIKASKVDLRADVFTMGTLAYLMLAGAPPFTADSVPDLLFKIVREDPPSLCARHPGLPQEVERVIFRALAKNRRDRFSSMAEFSRQLVEAAAQAANVQDEIDYQAALAADQATVGSLDDATLMDEVPPGSLALEEGSLHQEPTLIKPLQTGPHLPDTAPSPMWTPAPAGDPPWPEPPVPEDDPTEDMEVTAMVDARTVSGPGSPEPGRARAVLLLVALAVLAVGLGVSVVLLVVSW